MGSNSDVAREIWVPSRTSQAGAGTVTVGTFATIDGIPIYKFDTITIRIVHATPLAGGGTLDLYFQKAVAFVAATLLPDPTDDTHWHDYARNTQVLTTMNDVIELGTGRPVGPSNPSQLATSGGAKDLRAITGGDAARGTHWGDRLRLQEVVAGTITQAAIYSVFATGVIVN